MAAGSVEMKVYDMKEVCKHTTEQDCWMVLYNRVYNLSSYLGLHPAGKEILLQYAGKDATQIFQTIHSEPILRTLLPKDCLLGKIAVDSIEPHHKAIDKSLHRKRANIAPLAKLINIFDFEQNAAKILAGSRAYNHIFGGACDEITLRKNATFFNKIYFRPKVMVDVSNISMECKLFGLYPCSFPLFLSTTGLAGLAHPDAECALINAAKREHIYFCLSTFPSKSFDEIARDCVDADYKDNCLMFQAYILKDRARIEELIENAVKHGFCKILCITVDHAVGGKRERDMRGFQSHAGIAKHLAPMISDALNWSDLQWIKQFVQELSVKYAVRSGIKLVLKGIQSGWDAINAYKHGVDGIIVSNHGGRQLDYSRASMQVLIEVMRDLKRIDAADKLEVYMDGGIRRGSDIFKALAVGAKAVGIGRAALWGLTCYGQEGAQRVIQCLRNELEITMKLMGVTSIEEIRANMYKHADNNMLIVDDIVCRL
mmetsp:Transcript_62870/g.99811  ORF Transcript_62870/g.99811 Transcript_62870/m.99811 type:complete len:485 (+) Transcript_62870:24-1478(+)